jgi:iron(III) transport system ATP-binding protein
LVDEDVTRLEPHKRNTGMMFQSYALWPHMTVAENVAFGLEERKVGKARKSSAALARRSNPCAWRVCGAAPQSAFRRTAAARALARALVIRPRCLLLDEPLSNLDAKLRLEMRTEIRRVCKEFKLTTVYVTHDQKEALSVSDRMAILESGHILQVGSPREIYRRPVQDGGDFIGETDFFDGTVAGLEIRPGGGRHGDWSLRGRARRCHRRCDRGAVTLSVRPECWVLRRGAGAQCGARLHRRVDLPGELAQYDVLRRTHPEDL